MPEKAIVILNWLLFCIRCLAFITKIILIHFMICHGCKYQFSSHQRTDVIYRMLSALWSLSLSRLYALSKHPAISTLNAFCLFPLTNHYLESNIITFEPTVAPIFSNQRQTTNNLRVVCCLNNIEYREIHSNIWNTRANHPTFYELALPWILSSREPFDNFLTDTKPNTFKPRASQYPSTWHQPEYFRAKKHSSKYRF